MSKHRKTLSASIRTASTTGQAAAFAKYGAGISPAEFHARMLRELQANLNRERRPAARAVIEAAIRDSQERVAHYSAKAIADGDAETLRLLAEISERRPTSTAADGVRHALLILKAKLEESTAPNGEPWICRDIRQLVRVSGYRGDLRGFRRILRELNFPYVAPIGGRPKTRTNKREDSPSVS